MGTRGAFGFRLGIDKVTYNHYDSYPEGLGKDVVAWIGRSLNTKDKLKEKMTLVEELRVIDSNNSEVTENDVKKFRKFTDTSVDETVKSGMLPSWYQLLRHTQGSLTKMLEAGAMIDGSDFILDSLFCEFAYIINFDDMTFEVYRGFQRKKHNLGRFCEMMNIKAHRSMDDQYYPVALKGALPLDNHSEWKNTWIKDLFPPTLEDE